MDKDLPKDTPTQEDPKKDIAHAKPKRNLKEPIMIVVGLILISILIVYFYYLTTPAPDPNSSSISPTPAATSNNWPTSQTNSEYTTILSPNTQNESLTDVYVQNEGSDEQIFLLTLEDVDRNRANNGAYVDKTLYIIRRIDYDGYPDEEWTDELWRYGAQGIGSKLFESQGLSFLVSPNGEMIALDIPTDNDSKSIVIDANGQMLHEYELQDLDLDLEDNATWPNFIKWSDDSQLLWGSVSFTTFPASYFKINLTDWSVDKYDVTKTNMVSGGALNANISKIVYSDHPVFFDSPEYEKFVAKAPTVTLYLYDFETQVETEIEAAVGNAWKFNPSWIDDTSFEYDDPDGSRTVYKLQ